MYELGDLWFAHYAPNRKKAKKGSEYAALAEKHAETRLALAESLTEVGKQHFERYERGNETLAEISEEDTFIEGFRLGARMILDVLNEYHSQFE